MSKKLELEAGSRAILTGSSSARAWKIGLVPPLVLSSKPFTSNIFVHCQLTMKDIIVKYSSALTGFILFGRNTLSYCNFTSTWHYLELERVPDPAGRLGPDKKLTGYEPNTRDYPGLNLGKAWEPLWKLNEAWNLDHEIWWVKIYDFNRLDANPAALDPICFFWMYLKKVELEQA